MIGFLKNVAKNSKVFFIIGMILSYAAGSLFGFPCRMLESYEDCIINELYAVGANEDIGTFKDTTLESALSSEKKDKERAITRLTTITKEYNLDGVSGDGKETFLAIKVAQEICE